MLILSIGGLIEITTPEGSEIEHLLSSLVLSSHF